MRLYTASLVLFLFSVPVAAQSRTAAPKAVKSVENIEDIEIGMSADLVIAGLTKRGYTFRDQLKGDVPNKALWSVSYGGKQTGEVTAEEGRVTAAEVSVYNSTETAPGGGAIDLAEALYWIFYDNGLTLPSQDRDLRQTRTGAQFTTREIESRTTGYSYRMIFADMANGASYRITLVRSPGDSHVFVSRLAPFVKRK
jgi:hypothetical protein